MSAGEPRPARPRPFARTRQRIARKPWGMPSRLEPPPARENASGVGGGVEGGRHKSKSGCSVGVEPWRQQGRHHAWPALHPRVRHAALAGVEGV